MKIKLTDNSPPVETRESSCKHCDAVIVSPKKRGRAPKVCKDCKSKPKDSLDPEAKRRQRELAEAKGRETVDQLELMLKSRGTHIQQNWKD